MPNFVTFILKAILKCVCNDVNKVLRDCTYMIGWLAVAVSGILTVGKLGIHNARLCMVV